MRRHLIIGRLGPDDRVGVPSAADEVVTRLELVTGDCLLGHGIGRAIADGDAAPGAAAVGRAGPGSARFTIGQPGCRLVSLAGAWNSLSQAAGRPKTSP